MMKAIKPTLVLLIITTVVSALLIVTYNLTYVDTSGIITEKMQLACEELMGEGSYEIVTDWEEEGYAIPKPDTVEKLIRKSDGTVAFEIITSGYSKDGLDMLVAMNPDGSVMGVAVVSISETPGLGTKVQDSGFLSQYSGKSGELTVVKTAPSADNEIEAVTSATYSSKGVTKAVNIAISTYKELGGTK